MPMFFNLKLTVNWVFGIFQLEDKVSAHSFPHKNHKRITFTSVKWPASTNKNLTLFGKEINEFLWLSYYRVLKCDVPNIWIFQIMEFIKMFAKSMMKNAYLPKICILLQFGGKDIGTFMLQFLHTNPNFVSILNVRVRPSIYVNFQTPQLTSALISPTDGMPGF